jgi:hypothetical protein
MTALSADDVIRLLNLQPHPERGHYRETFRDESSGTDGRAASTAIYYLLANNEISRWHRVDAAEIWHWYAGTTLMLSMSPPNGVAAHTRLGPGLAEGERPQAVVPKGHWQQARSCGAWTLVGCTVAPGFTFEGFELAHEGFEPGNSA